MVRERESGSDKKQAVGREFIYQQPTIAIEKLPSIMEDGKNIQHSNRIDLPEVPKIPPPSTHTHLNTHIHRAIFSFWLLLLASPSRTWMVICSGNAGGTDGSAVWPNRRTLLSHACRRVSSAPFNRGSSHSQSTSQGVWCRSGDCFFAVVVIVCKLGVTVCVCASVEVSRRKTYLWGEKKLFTYTTSTSAPWCSAFRGGRRGSVPLLLLCTLLPVSFLLGNVVCFLVACFLKEAKVLLLEFFFMWTPNKPKKE